MPYKKFKEIFDGGIIMANGEIVQVLPDFL